MHQAPVNVVHQVYMDSGGFVPPFLLPLDTPACIIYLMYPTILAAQIIGTDLMMWCIIIKYQNVVSKQKQPGCKKGMAKQIVNNS